MRNFIDDLIRDYPRMVKKTRRTKKMCEACGKRVATYYKKGRKGKARNRVRTGKHHTLCTQCFSKELNKMRAARLAQEEERERRKRRAAEASRQKKMTTEQRGEERRRKKRQRKGWEKKQDLARDAGRRAKEEK